MSKHVSEWLNAYHDGQLRGGRLHQVEMHLADCELCQIELESLDGLSTLLREAPTPEFMLPERFAAQVSLRLPHPPRVAPRKQIIEIGWWMIPVGLLAAWVFLSTSMFVGDMVSAASRLGLLSSLSGWLSFASNDVYWSANLGELGILSGSSLNWAAATEAFTRSILPQFVLQTSIALLYLSWIAIWWTRRTRPAPQPHGQLLEG